ncbi:MAG: NUDIX domain-containing protein [Nanoarchaeota archaeon]
MERPGVGLSAIVIKDNKILMGKRKNSHGAGTLAFPGGHLEIYESFGNCLLREVKEETDLKVILIDEFPVKATEDFFKTENKHYVTLFMRAKYVEGDLKILEPDKCEFWKWFSWYDINTMPSNQLFLPVQNLIKQGYNPFSDGRHR